MVTLVRRRKGMSLSGWTLLALLLGLTIGGSFPDLAAPIASGTAAALSVLVKVIPLLIVLALSPAVYKLTSIGRAGRLAGSTLAWYTFTSVAAGLVGVMVSSILFDISFAASQGQLSPGVIEAFGSLLAAAGVSLPLAAIPVSVILGVSATRLTFLRSLLDAFDKVLSSSASHISRSMPTIVLFLGITLGVRSGAAENLRLYGWMCVYTLFLCAIWWLIYVFLVLKLIARQPVKRVMREYYIPTALFALGTCSSLATLPVNLENVKRYGVDHDLANFVVPIGAVVNMDMSAMSYVAYAPFIMTVVFDLPITWSVLAIAWPAIVLFSIASPGLGAGIGTALWSATLFASLLGLSGDDRNYFIATWLAFSGGLPDMLRTTANVTGDGFTAIFLNHVFRKSSGGS